MVESTRIDNSSHTMRTTLSTLILTAAAALAADMPMLNERLILDLPEEAQYGQRTTALMAADPGDDETLIWIGDDGDRIAVYAKELDVLADADFDKQAREFLDAYNEKAPLYEIKALSADVYCALRKEAPARATGADLFGVALVRHRDGSLIRMQILFAANHVTKPTACRSWAENAFRGIRFGSGTRNSAARQDDLNFFNELVLEVPVPEGYVRTINPGVDFTYTTYTKLTTWDAPTDYFAIYLGDHPNFEERKDAQKVKSSAAGKKVTWFCFSPGAGVYAAECCVRLSGLLNFSAPPLYMHLIIVAPSAEERTAQINRLTQLKKKDVPPQSKK